MSTQLSCLAMLIVLVGLSPNVQGTNLDSTHIVMHFPGPDSTSDVGFSGLRGVGDVNGDGYDDVAVTCDSPVGTYVFFGGRTNDSIPDMYLRGQAGVAEPIDLDGDGIDDLTISYAYYVPNHTHGMLYFYKGYGDSLASQPYDSLRPDSINYGFGGASTGYVDGDALGDLIAYRWDSLGSGKIEYYSGCPQLDKDVDWVYQEIGFRYQIRGSLLIDFDGDGRLDILIGLSPGTNPAADTSGYLYVYGGPEFSDRPDRIIAPPLEILAEHSGYSKKEFCYNGLFHVGDINEDGWPDLGVDFASNGLIYLCGPEADTLYDYELQGKCSRMANAGDIDGDTTDDLIAYGALSANRNIDIYLGGIPFDTVQDDYIFRSELPPFYLTQIGRNLASAGDYNGDGIDDIVFTCSNFFGGTRGDVFVVAGGDSIPTDVLGQDEGLPIGPGIPTRAYPNPFNSGVTIEFTLPTRSDVSLRIFDILGREVTTLIEGQSRARGTHQVEWSAMRTGGETIASGVYLYCLSTSAGMSSGRVLLLK